MNPQSQSQPSSPASLEIPAASRLHVHRAFRSRFLPDDRDIVVYLPPGYNLNAARSYPVLYMHDGQNLFDGRTSFIPGRTWQVRENADAAIEAGEVEPLIIVGIYNTGARRVAEYTHDHSAEKSASARTANDRDPQRGGEAGSYGLLLTEDLMPWIAARYRIRPGRESTGIAGSSLGGLVSLYLGLRFPQFFGKLGVLSPSVWWNHKSILGYLNEQAPQIWERPRLWLDVGDTEGRRTVLDAEQLARRLRANGWVDGQTLHFERIPGGTHDEASWALRVRPMLRFLFPAA